MKSNHYRAISLIFAIIMLFSVTTAYAQGLTRSTTRTITKDTIYSGTLTAGSTDTYYFTPSYSGMFTVETFGSTDTYGTVSGNTRERFFPQPPMTIAAPEAILLSVLASRPEARQL